MEDRKLQTMERWLSHGALLAPLACRRVRVGVAACRCVGVGRCCIAASTVRRRWCGGGVVVVVVVLVVELVVVLVVVVAVAVVVVVVVVVVLPVALRLPCGDVVGCCCSIRSIERSPLNLSREKSRMHLPGNEEGKRCRTPTRKKCGGQGNKPLPCGFVCSANAN